MRLAQPLLLPLLTRPALGVSRVQMCPLLVLFALNFLGFVGAVLDSNLHSFSLRHLLGVRDALHRHPADHLAREVHEAKVMIDTPPEFWPPVYLTIREILSTQADAIAFAEWLARDGGFRNQVLNAATWKQRQQLHKLLDSIESYARASADAATAAGLRARAVAEKKAGRVGKARARRLVEARKVESKSRAP